jgi:hypothetical protein
LRTTHDADDDPRGRALAAAEIVGMALERDLPHMALGAAREAARSALLALAAVPGPRLPDRDLGLLRDLAASSPQRFAGRPAERAAVVRATRALVGGLFPGEHAP